MKVILEPEDKEKLIKLLPEEIQSFRNEILKNLEETCCIDDRVRDYINTLVLNVMLKRLNVTLKRRNKD